MRTVGRKRCGPRSTSKASFLRSRHQGSNCGAGRAVFTVGRAEAACNGSGKKTAGAQNLGRGSRRCCTSPIRTGAELFYRDRPGHEAARQGARTQPVLPGRLERLPAVPARGDEKRRQAAPQRRRGTVPRLLPGAPGGLRRLEGPISRARASRSFKRCSGPTDRRSTSRIPAAICWRSPTPTSGRADLELSRGSRKEERLAGGEVRGGGITRCRARKPRAVGASGGTSYSPLPYLTRSVPLRAARPQIH